LKDARIGIAPPNSRSLSENSSLLENAAFESSNFQGILEVRYGTISGLMSRPVIELPAGQPSEKMSTELRPVVAIFRVPLAASMFVAVLGVWRRAGGRYM
jgi:hypothetical protein